MYNSANFTGTSKGALHTQLVIMLKHWGFFIFKMNTTLFQINLKFIWAKRQECERKHTFFYLIIIYRQIIWFWGGLASLVRLEYLTENSFGTNCRTGYNIVYSVQARFFFISMEQRPEYFSNFGWPDYLFYLQKLPDPTAESIGFPQNKPWNKQTKLWNGWCQNNGDKLWTK